MNDICEKVKQSQANKIVYPTTLDTSLLRKYLLAIDDGKVKIIK